MASRFWVGGTGTWDNSTTTHWSATTGGAGGASVPGAADDVTFDGLSGVGTVTLAYSPTILSLNQGTFAGTMDFVTYSPTMDHFNGDGVAVRTLKMGTGTWTITGTGVGWDMTTNANLTLDPGRSTIKYTDTSSTNKIFRGGNNTYNNIYFAGGGPGMFRYAQTQDAEVAGDFAADPGSIIEFFRSGTFTFNDLHLRGTKENPIIIRSSLAGTPFNVTNNGWVMHPLENYPGPDGAYAMDYLIISDSNASGTEPFYAGVNSVNAGAIADGLSRTLRLSNNFLIQSILAHRAFVTKY